MPAPQFRAAADNALVLRRKEFLRDVKVVSGNYDYFFTINPGIHYAGTSGWLSSIASNFEFFKIVAIVLHYVPRCAADTTGDVVLATEYDWEDHQSGGGRVPTRAELLNSTGAVNGPLWGAHSTRFDLAKQRSKEWKRVATLQDLKDPKDVATTFAGVFYIRIEGGMASAGANFTAGSLWMEYVYQLKSPAINAPISNIIAQQNLDVLGVVGGAAQFVYENWGLIALAAKWILGTPSAGTNTDSYDRYQLTLPRSFTGMIRYWTRNATGGCSAPVLETYSPSVKFNRHDDLDRNNRVPFNMRHGILTSVQCDDEDPEPYLEFRHGLQGEKCQIVVQLVDTNTAGAYADMAAMGYLATSTYQTTSTLSSGATFAQGDFTPGAPPVFDVRNKLPPTGGVTLNAAGLITFPADWQGLVTVRIEDGNSDVPPVTCVAGLGTTATVTEVDLSLPAANDLLKVWRIQNTVAGEALDFTLAGGSVAHDSTIRVVPLALGQQ